MGAFTGQGLQEQKNNSAKKKTKKRSHIETVLGNNVLTQMSCITVWAVLLRMLCIVYLRCREQFLSI